MYGQCFFRPLRGSQPALRPLTQGLRPGLNSVAPDGAKPEVGRTSNAIVLPSCPQRSFLTITDSVLGLSSIHRRSRHSREGGNPLLVGSPGPPAYAGVTTRRFSSPWAAGPPTLRMTCRDFSATSQISVPPRREQ